MFRRRMLRGTVSAAIAIVISAYALPGVAEKLAVEQVAVFGIGFNDIAALDPYMAVGSGEAPIAQEIFQGPVEFPLGEWDDEKVRPALAATSQDKIKWTSYLRRGVQWHKGSSEVTADNVKYSIYRILDKTTGSPLRGNLRNINRLESSTDTPSASSLPPFQ